MDTKKLKTRDQIDDKYKWSVDKIYATDEKWEEDFEILRKLIPNLANGKGMLHDSDVLLKSFTESEKIERLYGKLFMYATFKHHENTNNPKYQSMVAKIESCGTEMKTLSSFFEPEIISIGKERLNIVLNSNKELELYRKFLYSILDSAKHMLSKDVEAALAQVSDAMDTPDAVFSSFSNSDLKFPKVIDEDGNEFDLTESNYTQYVRNESRVIRKDAFNKLFTTFGSFKNTLGSNYLANVRNLSNIAKLRKYNSSIECALDSDMIPVSVYKTTVDTVNANLSSLHRYVSLKKKLLEYDEIHMYDLYAPLFEKPTSNYPFEEAVEIVKDSISILGEDYVKVATEGLKSGWCDVYPNEGKRSGAYSWGSYDTMPYFMLNYVNELNNVFTLTHELGHSMHSYYSKTHQPYIYHHYTIFNAEVASTCNEILLINHLIKNCTDKKTKQYLINHELEQIRATIFRQTMFAEFEMVVHEKIDKGEGLSAQDLCDIYYNINTKYFGEEMVVDKEIAYEWMRIPHFYSNFYVFKYVTGYAAATMFASSLLNNQEGALDNYKKFLCAGGSDYSINIQQSCGVDMTTSKPLEVVMDRFNYLLDELEKCI